jgi:hypothetical protein
LHLAFRGVDARLRRCRRERRVRLLLAWTRRGDGGLRFCLQRCRASKAVLLCDALDHHRDRFGLGWGAGLGLADPESRLSLLLHMDARLGDQALGAMPERQAASEFSSRQSALEVGARQAEAEPQRL